VIELSIKSKSKYGVGPRSSPPPPHFLSNILNLHAFLHHRNASFPTSSTVDQLLDLLVRGVGGHHEQEPVPRRLPLLGEVGHGGVGVVELSFKSKSKYDVSAPDLSSSPSYSPWYLGSTYWVVTGMQSSSPE
jgi:hypothetical protein